MRKLTGLFGNLEEFFKVIHVTGTNGKGSVSLKTAKAMESMGFKVGLFTSPHISSVRERFLVNSKMIDKEEFCEICEQVFRIIEFNDLKVTFFQILFMISILHFKR